MHRGAQADGRRRANPVRPEAGEERARRGARRGRGRVELGAVERVERISRHERRVERREDVRAAHRVQDREPAAQGHQRPALPVATPDDRLHGGDVVVAGRVDVAHRVRLGERVHPLRLLVDRRPDVALIGTRLEPGGHLLPHPLALGPAQAGERGLRGRGERLPMPAMVPAPLLHAGDRHRQRRSGRNQDGVIDRAVLLRPDQLFPS